MEEKENKQYELIQEFLTNDNFHFNHLMIRGIIEFLYEKFGSEFWKFIIENISERMFSRFRKYKWEQAKDSYNSDKAQRFYDKERRRSEERRRRNKELDEEEREYRKTHPNPWGH